MSDDIKIINADEAEKIQPDLPEAGWERNEELAKRKDGLEQAAEEVTEERELYTFDPSKFDPENEIMDHIDELFVDNRQADFEYSWVYDGQHGREIVKKQRLGWVVVQGDNPECAAVKDVRGYRKIGDVILMRVPKARFAKLQEAEDYRRLRQQKGVDGALREMSEKYRSKGVYVVDPREKAIGRSGSLMDAMEGKAKMHGAQQTAMKGVDNHLRQGTVPGMPAPGKGRR